MKVKTIVESLPLEEVYKELGTTKAAVQEDVEALKTWLLKQPHLPIIRSDWLTVPVDLWLERFLFLCKNSLERTKEAIDMYFTCRLQNPEIFGHRDPTSPQCKQSYRVFHIGTSPILTREGDRLMVFSHVKNTVDDFDPTYLFIRGTMLLDICLIEGITQAGVHIAVNFENVCFGHMTRYNIAQTKRMLEQTLKCMPFRIKKIHFLNPSPIIEAAVVCLRQVLAKKLVDRVVVHKDTSDFVKELGPEVAPVDFGGEGLSVQQISSFWEEKSITYRDWFLKADTMKADETKRVGKCRSETSEFGFQGSFRKIEVD